MNMIEQVPATFGLHPYIVLAFAAVLILTLTILLFIKRGNDKEKRDVRDENPVRPLSENQSLPEEQKSEKTTSVKNYETGGKSLTAIIDDLYREFSDAEKVILKKVTYEEKRLIGVFLIQRSDRLLEHREINHSILTRNEIESEGEIGEIESISDIERDRLYHGTIEFLVDEYKNVYVKSGDTIKNVSSEKVRRQNIISQGREWVGFTQNIPLNRLRIKNISSEENKLILLLGEENSIEDHRLVIKEGKGVIEYNKTDSQMFSHEKEGPEFSELEFTHGIEVELQVIKKDWSWVDGNQMTIVFEEILNGALEKLRMSREEAPPLVRRKWTGKIETGEDDKGYEAIHIQYSCDNKEEQYSIFGKDSHVALKTNILEIKTPPCEYLEEIEWWIHNLYKIAQEVVEELDIGATVLSIGTNPVEEYSEGVSFGEHHHLGFEDDKLRKKAYNLFRYFIPHLIGISTDSPFHAGAFPNYTYNDFNNLVITESSYSMRLKKNNEQFKVPPHLPINEDKKYFEETLGRVDEPLRMIDIFPFTRFDTIEVRIFDTQLTTLDRMTLAIVLQALTMYARDHMDEKKKNALISDGTLKKNRKEAVENGLLGRFYVEETIEDRYPIIEKSQKKYLYESWRKILGELWPYFDKMGVTDTLYLKNLILRLYSCEKISLEPPVSPAQLILYHQGEGEKELQDILKNIRSMGVRAAGDPEYHLWPNDLALEKISISGDEDIDVSVDE